MSLQDIFYGVSIVFMVFVMLLFLGLAVAAYKIQKRIAKIRKMAMSPAETVAQIGAGIVEGLSVKFQDFLRGKSSNRRRR